MSTRTLLTSLFQYKRWADEHLIAGLELLADGAPPQAMRLFHHAHVVDRIFAANLQGLAHGLRETDLDDVPPAKRLYEAVRQTDG